MGAPCVCFVFQNSGFLSQSQNDRRHECEFEWLFVVCLYVWPCEGLKKLSTMYPAFSQWLLKAGFSEKEVAVKANGWIFESF